MNGKHKELDGAKAPQIRSMEEWESMYEEIRTQTAECLSALLADAGLKAGDILVVGCSTSEVIGKKIGTASSDEVGEAIFAAIYPALQRSGIWLAAQCCEHLNRALVIEREAADCFHLPVVTVVPVREAGGSWAAGTYRNLKEAVVVENLDHHKASAGIDIGEVCIGMHLRPVGVMVRPLKPWIGEARVTMVRTRPKLIGGSRAKYE